MAMHITQATPKRVNRYRCAGCGAKMALRELCSDCRAVREEARMWAAVGYWLPVMQRQMDAYLAAFEAGLPDPEPDPPAPLPEKATRSRWERKSHYHQVAAARRASKRGFYVVNRADEWADYEGHFGGDAA